MTVDNTKYYFSLAIDHEQLGSFPCETRATTKTTPGEYSVYIISTVSEMIKTHIPELIYWNSLQLDLDGVSEDWELIIEQFASEKAYEKYTNFKCYHEYDDKIPRLNVTPFALENRLLLSVFKAHLKYEIKE
tara:strand:+ start:261 stop:656 length:396 start_codon:yes stop_codon:yes gene_type:complete